MKKTVNINLAGRAFIIDEDAYEELRHYLQALEKHFLQTEGSNEIIEDIEDGLAHIMHLNLGKRKIVTIDDVKKAIVSMGKPDDFNYDVPSSSKTKTSETKAEEPRRIKASNKEWDAPRQQRKLYRDKDNGIVAGVCAGIANYFNVDPWIVRLIFIIGFIPGVGSPLVFYILLWFLIPPAQTPAEKMHMHGSDINLHNIVRKAEQEIRDLADRLTEWTEKKINKY